MKKNHTAALTPLITHALFALLLAVPCLAASLAKAEVIDRVMAEVNDDVITLSEVEQEGRMIFQKIAREVAPEEREVTINKVRQEVLDNIIDKRLIAQEAAKQNLTVSGEELDAAIEKILSTNNISREDFINELYKNGIDEETYRSNLRSQILQNKLISREISSKIVVTEDMILDAYDTKYTRQVKEGGYYLMQIGISWGESEASQKSTAALYEDKVAARKKIERVHQLAVNGEDFRELARRFSDLPSSVEGGDIGVFSEDEMAQYMKDVVVGLKAGEISQIVETPVGFQFFKLLSSKEGGIVTQAPYESVKEEIRERLFRDAMQKEYSAWLKKIRERAYIRKL